MYVVSPQNILFTIEREEKALLAKYGYGVTKVSSITLVADRMPHQRNQSYIICTKTRAPCHQLGNV